MQEIQTELRTTWDRFRTLSLLQQAVFFILALQVPLYFASAYLVDFDLVAKVSFCVLAGLCVADIALGMIQNNQQRASLGLSLLMLVVVLYSYAYELWRIVNSWTRPEYELGYIIPFIAIVVLWVWRKPYQLPQMWETLVGLGAILASIGIRYQLFFVYGREQFALYSLITVIAGLVMMFGGTKMLSWTWPGILLLLLAIPFSSKMEFYSFRVLQEISTTCSVFTLETIGANVTNEGNSIELFSGGEELKLNVAEACAGFRSMLLLMAITLSWAFLVESDLWIKIVIVASAPLIALAANVVRIVFQCFAYMISADGGHYFHDYFAGFVVLPVMVGLLYLEYAILKNLVIDDIHSATMPLRPIGAVGGIAGDRGAAIRPLVPVGGTRLPSVPGVPVARPAIPPVFKR